VEHHRSSFDASTPTNLTEWDKSAGSHSLLPHEFVHSWNGKVSPSRRPWTANYNVPMRNSLLGCMRPDAILGHRAGRSSGLWTKQQSLDDLANGHGEISRTARPRLAIASGYDRPARSSNTTPLAWRSWQRATTYYDVGASSGWTSTRLIREQSQGSARSDDFAKRSSASMTAAMMSLTYTFTDIVAALTGCNPTIGLTFCAKDSMP